MRILAWNIRAGGGVRAGLIARQIARWAPDIVALSEFRASPPSRALAATLAAALPHQLTTADATAPHANALLVAARWPLRRLRLRAGAVAPRRWLVAAVDAPQPIVIGTLHAPNRAEGPKYEFLAGILTCVRGWRLGPALIVGDTNSGRRGLDEQVPAFSAVEEGWIDGLQGCGWMDAFRHLQPETRVYTWYSPNGRHGFRIDQAFVNAPLLARLKDAQYVWGGASRRGRRARLSDHAALLVDLADV
jgi:exodeoxyribonuclease III